MNRVKTREIDIDPRGEITWETTDATIDDQNGVLLTSPNSPVKDPLLSLRQFAFDKDITPRFNYGAQGSIYATPENYAVKDFNLGGDIGFLRANVILAEGLKHVAQSDEEEFHIRGLEIHAAFIPSGYEMREMGARCLWLMEHVTELSNYGITAPTYRLQKELYTKAIEHYKVTNHDICFDCGITGYETTLHGLSWHNLMIEQYADSEQPAQYVKIDAIPSGPLLNRY